MYKKYISIDINMSNCVQKDFILFFVISTTYFNFQQNIHLFSVKSCSMAFKHVFKLIGLKCLMVHKTA